MYVHTDALSSAYSAWPGRSGLARTPAAVTGGIRSYPTRTAQAPLRLPAEAASAPHFYRAFAAQPNIATQSVIFCTLLHS